MFRRYFTKAGREENRLLNEALKTGDTMELAKFIRDHGRFRISRIFLFSYEGRSASDRITYALSPYGSMVKIDNGPLLDVQYGDYGFSREMGRNTLYEAVLNANGTSSRSEIGMGLGI